MICCSIKQNGNNNVSDFKIDYNFKGEIFQIFCRSQTCNHFGTDIMTSNFSCHMSSSTVLTKPAYYKLHLKQHSADYCAIKLCIVRSFELDSKPNNISNFKLQDIYSQHTQHKQHQSKSTCLNSGERVCIGHYLAVRAPMLKPT